MVNLLEGAHSVTYVQKMHQFGALDMCFAEHRHNQVFVVFMRVCDGHFICVITERKTGALNTSDAIEVALLHQQES